MKQLITKISSLVAAVLAGLLLTGCNPEDMATEFSVMVKEVGADYVEFNVVAKNCHEVAYVCTTSEREYNENLIFAGGTTIKGGSEQVVRIGNLNTETKYRVSFAARVTASTFFGKVEKHEITTGSYLFDDLLTIVDTYYDGFKAHINLPAETEARGNAIRFAHCCVMMYNYARRTMGMEDYSSLLYNGSGPALVDKGGNTTTKDYTGIFNEMSNWYQTGADSDFDGEEDWDNKFNPISPGEPCVMIAGEFEWMDEKEDDEAAPGHEVFPYPSGWDSGYYYPLLNPEYFYGGSDSGEGDGDSSAEQSSVEMLDKVFDMSQPMDSYWTGAFDRKVFRVKEPEDMGDDKITIDVHSVEAVNAIIDIVCDESVQQFAYWIADDGTYEEMLKLIDGNTDYEQWAITSYFGAYTFGCALQPGNEGRIILEDFLASVTPETNINVLVTGIGNSDATKQCFKKVKFQLDPGHIEPPIIDVECVEELCTPYEAVFRVKNRKYDGTKDNNVKKAWYGLNFVRDWELTTNSGSTYSSLVQNAFFQAEIDGWTDSETGITYSGINSEEGYLMRVPTIDGETIRVIVKATNMENEENNIDAYVGDITNCPAVAEYKAPYAPQKDKAPGVTEFAEAVGGKWRASATIWDTTVDEEYTYETEILLSRSIDYEETLPEEVKELYLSLENKDGDPVYDEEAVETMYENFKLSAQEYCTERLVLQNRVLCQGWFNLDQYGRMDTMTPYDLFIDERYSSIDVASIFYDFGPKWYLEVLADGSVVVPFDMTYMPPASAYNNYPCYMMGYEKSEGQSVGGTELDAETGELIPCSFPVEVSENRDRLTINPIVADKEGKTYTMYPNIFGYYMGQWDTDYIVVSPVVLTKVGSEADKAAANAKSVSRKVSGKPAAVQADLDYSRLNIPLKPFTKLVPVEERQLPEIKGEIMTMDKVQKRYEKLNKKLNVRR